MNKIIVTEDSLNNVLENPKHRKIAYKVYTALGIILGAIQAGFVIYGYEAEWFTATVAVYLFLAVPFGGLALTNTPSKEQQEYISDEGEIE